jgi:hypothetical protein
MWAKLPLFPSRLREGLGVGGTTGSLAAFNVEALPRPLPPAGGESR